MSIHLVNQSATAPALKAGSVHMVVTSPPYFKLRAYATGAKKTQEIGTENLHDCLGWATGQSCGACFVCRTRQWAREVWRVLRPEGTFWLNIGDSYNGSGGAGGDYGPHGSKAGQPKYKGATVKALKPKDMIGIPWRVALALQADGWYLRNAIIWHKPASMPESAPDRFTNAYEHVFLFAKSQKYFFDQEAVREPVKESSKARAMRGKSKHSKYGIGVPGKAPQGIDFERPNAKKAGITPDLPQAANKRDVWKISTSQYKGGHYATFPPGLVETPIKAGTSEHGVCCTCGAPWQRVTKRTFKGLYNAREAKNQRTKNPMTGGMDKVTLGRTEHIERVTAGWLPTCECYRTRNPEKRRRQDLQNAWTPRAQAGRAPVKPALVYDPFIGSGTTLEVARQLGRSGIGGDLSYTYLTQEAKKRLLFTDLENWQAGKPLAEKQPAQAEPLPVLPLFAGMDF